MGLAHAAAAQAPGQVEPATAAFLEKRVPEELASEGVVLSRTNLGLKLEQVGTQWLVSLIDLSTERIAASTKLDVLPPDREAAVAAMTHVVAELATQIIGHAERPPAPPAPPPPPGPAPAPGLSAEREVADLKFNRQAIRFGTTFVIGRGSIQQVESRRGWKTYQGDLDEEMSPEKFYTAVGRPELIEGYQNRKAAAIWGWVVGGVGAAASLAILFSTPVEDANFSRNFAIGCGALTVGGVGFLWGFYYTTHPQPIDASEAKSLADNYNQGLRRRLGLPVAERRPLLRDLRLAPYATGTTGGIALSARF